MEPNFIRACRVEELVEGTALSRAINGWPVMLARSKGSVFALLDRCSHAESPLSTGRVRRGMIICPLHGACFELGTGRNIGNTYLPLKTFAAREADGWIEVEVPAERPSPEHLPASAVTPS